MATLSESALQKLGLDADADEAAIDEAVEKLTVTPDVGGAAPDVAAEPTIEQAAAIAAKFGQKLVDAAGHDQLVATVASLAARHEAEVANESESVIRDAVKSGRISPATADTWRDEIKKNPTGTKALIATLPENAALPVGEYGHGVDSEGSAVDAEMAGVYARLTGTQYGKDA